MCGSFSVVIVFARNMCTKLDSAPENKTQYIWCDYFRYMSLSVTVVRCVEWSSIDTKRLPVTAGYPLSILSQSNYISHLEEKAYAYIDHIILSSSIRFTCIGYIILALVFEITKVRDKVCYAFTFGRTKWSIYWIKLQSYARLHHLNNGFGMRFIRRHIHVPARLSPPVTYPADFKLNCL